MAVRTMKHLVIGFLAASAFTAHAEFMDGNSLLNDMSSSSFSQRGIGLGYVMGIADTMQGYTHCIPGNVSSGQIKDMVKNYLTNTPAERHLMAPEIVLKITSTVWPCPVKGKSL
jgi:hypothetical protein